MKAPKKIYVCIPDDDIVGTASTQKGFPHQFVTEEYIRADAFIEKACEAYCKLCKMPNCRRNECKMVDDFRHCMKGE